MKHTNLKKAAAVLICAFLCAGVLPPSDYIAVEVPEKSETSIAEVPEKAATDAAEAPEESGYRNIAENTELVLFADIASGAFAVQNKTSGKMWYSTPPNAEEDDITIGSAKTELQSQVVIQYIYREDELVAESVKTANSYIECNQPGRIETKLIANGIRVTYDFADIGVIIPVEYTLDENYLTAEVDFTGTEVDNTVYLTGIQLLPSFGANNTSENGYLFIPDGCGAVIKFNNGIDSEIYEAMVYGNELALPEDMKTTQTETVRMPVYGIKDENDALFAVVTKGDKNLQIVAMNRNSTCGYDAVSSRRIIRQLAQKTIYEKDPANRQDIGRVTQADTEGYSVRFYFLSGEKADYTGMATVYRNYLENECGLEKNPQKPSFVLDLYGAIDYKASFLGIPYTSNKKLTTYEQAVEILSSLKDEGIADIAVRYMGWTGDGLLNIYRLKKAKPIELLGGEKKYLSLLDYAGENGIKIYSDVDIVKYRKGSASSAVKTVFEQISKQFHFLRSVYSRDTKTDDVRLLAPSRIDEAFKNAIKPILELSDENGISAACLGDILYSNFSSKDNTSRSEAGENIVSILKYVTDNGRALSVDGGNIFTVVYAERVYNVPISSSRYDIFDHDVPFYQIVLHGYVNICGSPFVQSSEPIDSFLKAVETGSELHYGGMYADANEVTGTRYDDLYSSTYTLWQDTAAKQYSEYMPLLRKIYDQTITGHEYLTDGVVRTVFENGIEVIVNYSDEDFKYGEQMVKAKGFSVSEGENLE